MTLNEGYAYSTRIQRPGKSVLAFLGDHFRHSTLETWRERLRAGELSLNGRVLEGDQPMQPGDLLVWNRPPWPEEDVPLRFEVIYQDDDLLAVNKPSGLPTIPAGGFLKHTLLTLVRERWPSASPLHRLGRGTSGLVLFSLKAEAGAALLADWRGQRVRKIYRALASGLAERDEYDIHLAIGPVPHAKLGEVFAASPHGKAAHSRARVLERRAGTGSTASTLFEVEIFTGRPHQIRIHLAGIGHPLRGDPLYAPGGFALPEALPGDLGYHLHAWHLAFTHPRTGAKLTLTAPPPEE